MMMFLSRYTVMNYFEDLWLKRWWWQEQAVRRAGRNENIPLLTLSKYFLLNYPTFKIHFSDSMGTRKSIHTKTNHFQQISMSPLKNISDFLSLANCCSIFSKVSESSPCTQRYQNWETIGPFTIQSTLFDTKLIQKWHCNTFKEKIPPLTFPI